MPRRFIDISTRIAVTANSTLWWAMNGTAETDVRHAGRHGDGNGQNVIDHQRASHRQAGGVAQIGGDHLVVAAARLG